MSSASKACRPAGRRAAALILMKVMWPPLGSASLRRSSPKQADADATPEVPHLLPVGISNEIEFEVSRVEPDISISSVAYLTPMRPTVAHPIRSASGRVFQNLGQKSGHEIGRKPSSRTVDFGRTNSS